LQGIVFSVRPPKKSWKHIANLSGGEKTLSSLSLVFALHHYKPTPLYVMDEIDAALDFKNVSIGKCCDMSRQGLVQLLRRWTGRVWARGVSATLSSTNMFIAERLSFYACSWPLYQGAHQERAVF
jgi:hypothetical protein